MLECAQDSLNFYGFTWNLEKEQRKATEHIPGCRLSIVASLLRSEKNFNVCKNLIFGTFKSLDSLDNSEFWLMDRENCICFGFECIWLGSAWFVCVKLYIYRIHLYIMGVGRNPEKFKSCRDVGSEFKNPARQTVVSTVYSWNPFSNRLKTCC